MFRGETQKADRQSRPTRRWRIGHKLTVASMLMILLTLLAGGVGLWQVLTIGQAISDARQKQQQLAWSLELLAAGHKLVAALDHVLVTQDPALMSTDVPVSLGSLSFYMETLQKAGGETGASDLLGEMQVAYSELRQAVSEVNVLARQELWTEVGVALEQEVRPANKRMDLLIQELVRQADRDVEAMAARTQVVIRQAALLLAVLVVLTTAIALGWRQFVFRELSSSISELRQGVARISSGDLEYKLDVRTGDEVEELGDEFNKMADELANVIGSLEQRVADRTRSLQTAAEVARAATSVLNMDELLNQVVTLINDRFDLYHTSLFLLDETGRWAKYRAGTGDVGRLTLERGFRFEVGGASMVGWCTAHARPRVALDVRQEPIYLEHPLLPNTRSKAALPLIARGRVIGALDVQSVKVAAFDKADIAVMQTMADQIAVAIDNARLFGEAQAALVEMEATHKRYLGEAWAQYVQTAKKTYYETEHPSAASLGDAVLPEIQQAVERQGTTVLNEPSTPRLRSRQTPRHVRDTASSGHGNGGEGKRSPEPVEGTGHSALVAPIALRGKVIGALGIHDEEDGARQWTDDEIAIVEAVAERVALAAENLRLLDETQRRAAREQLVSEISGRVRASLDPDTILKTTVRELGRVLGAQMTTVEVTGSERNDRGFLKKKPAREREE